jgi:predicted permease
MNQVKSAIRQLGKTPGLTAVAVLSLAIGIGANTAIFSLVDEFLLRSLPVPHPEALVLFRAVHAADGRMSLRGEGSGQLDPATGRASGTPFSLLAFERLRAQPSALSSVFAWSPYSQVNVLVRGVPEPTVSAQHVSGNYHAGLGVRAMLGRTLSPDDDRSSAPPVAVISYRFWETRFQRDPAVLGTTLVINTIPTAIVGVTAPGFEGAMQAGETADISTPLAQHRLFQPNRASRSKPWYWWVRIMGRLAPGATPEQARASLEPVFQQAAREGWLAGRTDEPNGAAMPGLPNLAADPGAQGENDTRRQYARSLRILMGLVGLVLLAACANVANLLMVRGNARRREIALRLALGASRRRVVWQLLVESLLLAGAGAALGVALAWWSRDLLLALRPFGNTTVVLDLPLDARVLAFTIASAVATVLAFGLTPALRATRVDLTTEFQGGARALGGGSRSRVSRAFMVVQAALSIVLLVSTGLFVRTVSHLQDVDAGFNRRGLALFRIDAASAGYTQDRFTTLHARIQARLETIPGAQAVTFSRVALLSRVRQNMRFSIPGRTLPPGAPANTLTNGLAANFFDAMELPLVLGREFSERDDESAPTVAIVNQAFVRTWFGGANPIGERLAFNAPGFKREVEIVGVAADAKYTELRGATPPTAYFPALQQPDGDASFAVRAGGDPAALYPAIRSAVREIDPTLPVLNLRTQAEQIERLHGQERLFARLSGFFGLTALALACVGLYGLMSHTVLRRTGEIGLRMALGAWPGLVLRMVLRESLILVSVGAALGLAAAYAASRLVATMLYDVSPTDPVTYGGVTLVLLGTALLASFLPAWRASRIEPLTALRSE